MKSFRLHQRIVVTHPSSHSALKGLWGTVVRLRFCDNGAWVRMEQLPEGLACFPDEKDERHNDIILYPGEVELGIVPKEEKP